MPANVARLIAVAAVTTALTLPLTAVSKPAKPAVPTAALQEAHPQINEAIRALEAAKDHLQRAAHDFGGHRVKAIRAVDAALVQLRLALKYDKE
jgi:hypothetical protein